LPILLISWLWFPTFRSNGELLIGIMITCGIAAWIAKKVGDNGREKERKLIKIWGGYPTTILLRHSDEIVSKITKQRYHNFLNSKMPDISLLNEKEENDNPEEADRVYESAIEWLKEYARDKEKNYLIFNDNIHYGFSRNLWALKPYALTINITGTILNLGLVYFMPSAISIEWCFVTAFILFSILVWIFGITQRFVYKAGEKYAKSLLAVCDRPLT